MDPLAFLTWQFVMFSLFVAAIMYVLRTIVEYAIPKAKTAKLWNSLLLMILPVIIGGLMGWLLKAYPYATGLTSIGDHIGYGSVAGLLSTIVFKVVKELLGSKIAAAAQGVLSAVSGATGGVVPVVTTTTTTSTATGTPDAPVVPGEEVPAVVQSVRASINQQ